MMAERLDHYPSNIDYFTNRAFFKNISAKVIDRAFFGSSFNRRTLLRREEHIGKSCRTSRRSGRICWLSSFFSKREGCCRQTFVNPIFAVLASQWDLGLLALFPTTAGS
jgi:hypothetical protein